MTISVEPDSDQAGVAAGDKATQQQQTGGKELDSATREAEKKEARLRAAMTGATALAFDVAWMAWTLGRADLAAGLDELDDVGGLLEKLVGTSAGSGPGAAGTE
jgi:hypothetical protein